MGGRALSLQRWSLAFTKRFLQSLLPHQEQLLLGSVPAPSEVSSVIGVCSVCCLQAEYKTEPALRRLTVSEEGHQGGVLGLESEEIPSHPVLDHHLGVAV